MGAQWKVKHKEAAANAKGKLFGKLVKEITIAARNGADISTNAHLRLVVEQAKKASMPRDTLERAIKKGSGQLGETVQYHRVTYEGFAPHQVPLIVECVTDNINRTVAEIRVAFRKGQLGASGSVSWDFNHVGLIEASPDSHRISNRPKRARPCSSPRPPTWMPCRKPCRSRVSPYCRPSSATSRRTRSVA